MNTAPVTTTLTDKGVALLPVTIGGETLPAGSTPQQRLEAHAKAGTQAHFHTDSTAMKFAQHDGMPAQAGAIAGKAPPPTPAQLERQNANRQAEFDAEMQARGLQRRPDGSTHADGEVDQESVAKLTTSYKYWFARKETEADRQELREAYQRDLVRLHNGRPLSELEIGVATGDVVSKMKGSKEVKPRETTPPVSQHPPEAWAKAHTTVADKEGWIPLERINKQGLSGYTLPRFVDGQTYHVSIFQDLANARKQGIRQEQVEGFIRAGMVQSGWLKA